MSRIYSNDSLTTLPVKTCHVSEWFIGKFTAKGDGVLLEGKVTKKSRYAIVDNTKNKHRYFVFHVKVKQAHRRKFDGSGKETTPNFSAKTKVSTGYLMSSYKTVDKGKTDKIENMKLKEIIGSEQLLSITENGPVSDVIPFWISEENVEQLDIDIDNEVRLKTKSDSQFIDQLLRIEIESRTVGNMAGDEKVGSSWTDKILANKGGDVSNKVPVVEGVDEDEWDD
uniref:arpin-like n=1 Tax=Styela clava TaxID=7725 RepID=UPI00193A24FB|nr:arpin-like [Styela clava]